MHHLEAIDPIESKRFMVPILNNIFAHTVCLPVLLYQIQRVLLGGSVGPLVPSS